MGTQQQDKSSGNAPKQQPGGGQQGTSPRTPGEIGKGGQDAGTIGSPSKQGDRKESGGREKGNS